MGGCFRSTEGRDRTGTSVTSSVFETDASTNSATWANAGAKIQFFLTRSVNNFKKISAIFFFPKVDFLEENFQK